MADVKKQLEYSEATQTLVGQQRRELMDTKTGELMHVDQITKWSMALRTSGSAISWTFFPFSVSWTASRWTYLST